MPCLQVGEVEFGIRIWDLGFGNDGAEGIGWNAEVGSGIWDFGFRIWKR